MSSRPDDVLHDIPGRIATVCDEDALLFWTAFCHGDERGLFTFMDPCGQYHIGISVLKDVVGGIDMIKIAALGISSFYQIGLFVLLVIRNSQIRPIHCDQMIAL